MINTVIYGDSHLRIEKNLDVQEIVNNMYRAFPELKEGLMYKRVGDTLIVKSLVVPDGFTFHKPVKEPVKPFYV